MHLRKRLLVVAFAAASLIPSVASAQRAGSEADRLFNEGKRLFGQQRYAQACELFAQSDRLEPSIGALGLLAACHERQGLWASAYREYLETARRAEEVGDSRAQFARDRANQLRTRVPTIKVRFTRPDPNVQVFRGGQLVPPEDYERPIMLDPGSYEIVAKAPSGQWTYAAVVNMGENVVVVVPPTETFATGGVPDSLGGGGPAGPNTNRPAGGPGVGPGVGGPGVEGEVDPMRKAAPYIVTGLGVASIGVGSFFGLQAMSKNDDSKDPTQCPPTAPTCDLRDDAKSAATLSTVFFAIGGVGVAAGIVLFATTPSGRSAPTSGAGPTISRRMPVKSRAHGLTVRVAPTLGGAFASGTF